MPTSLRLLYIATARATSNGAMHVHEASPLIQEVLIMPAPLLWGTGDVGWGLACADGVATGDFVGVNVLGVSSSVRASENDGTPVGMSDGWLDVNADGNLEGDAEGMPDAAS
jgi:hypothetical protein